MAQLSCRHVLLLLSARLTNVGADLRKKNQPTNKMFRVFFTAIAQKPGTESVECQVPSWELNSKKGWGVALLFISFQLFMGGSL